MRYEITKLDRVDKALVAAKDFIEIKGIDSYLAAYNAFAKEHKLGLKLVNKIQKKRVIAARRMGQFLEKIPKKREKGSSKKRTSLQSLPSQINKKQSHKLQTISKTPEKEILEIEHDIEEQDKEITVDKIYTEIKNKQKKEKIEEQKKKIAKNHKEEIINNVKKYDIIVIDPPWKYGREYDAKDSRVASPYPELGTLEIGKLFEDKILTSNNSIMWLWTTHKFINDAMVLMKGWGFEYKAILVWDKEKMGMGSWLRMQCEFCLLGIKGKPIWNVRDMRDIIREARTTHSTKPNVLYDLIDKNWGKEFLKMDFFSRKKREGWDVYGDEVNGGNKK